MKTKTSKFIFSSTAAATNEEQMNAVNEAANRDMLLSNISLDSSPFIAIAPNPISLMVKALPESRQKITPP